MNRFSITGDQHEQLRTRLTNSIQAMVSTQTRKLMKVNLQSRNAEQVIHDVEEKYLLDSVSKETFKKVLNEKQSHLSELRTRKEILHTSGVDYLRKLDEVIAKAANLRTLYTGLDLVNKQSFIRNLLGDDLRYTQGSYRTLLFIRLFKLVRR